jgi:outer membrane protein
MRTLLIKLRIPSLAALLLALSLNVTAQSSLDAYIDIGLQNNLVLQQKSVSLERALYSLKIANGMFMPSLALIGNYTTGDGGRSISLPVGDLLNPVYTTLNQLTDSDAFPQIENVEQNFFPQNFYDVRTRLSMPIFNTDLVYNKKIQAQQIQLQEFEVTIYKRELIRNIKVAYFNYLGARKGSAIYESALTRAMESKRVNESLLANGKGLPAYVLRAQSEMETLSAQKNEADQLVRNAQLYLNFLLNRDANLPIEETFDAALNNAVQLLAQPASGALREELLQVESGIEINSNIVKMKQSYWVPKVNGFVDVGAQAENLEYNNKANYYLLGLQLDMPLFAGFTNRHKTTQAKLDLKNAELNRNLVGQQVNMTSSFAQNSLRTAYQNYLSATKQLEAAQSYQHLIERGYKEGVNTFIESLDARNQLTTAQLLVTTNQYKVLVAEANLEREMATYVLNK